LKKCLPTVEIPNPDAIVADAASGQRGLFSGEELFGSGGNLLPASGLGGKNPSLGPI
jgi:hypothetical protein